MAILAKEHTWMPIVPPSNAPNQSPAPLENGVSLSQSLIWRLQREFYVQRGLKAWAEDLVPNFITKLIKDGSDDSKDEADA